MATLTVIPDPNGRNAEFEAEINAVMATVAAPDLEGSDKQIAWASDVRRAQVEVVAEEVVRCRRRVARDETAAARFDAMIKDLFDRMTAETSAGAWIDRRGRVGELDEVSEALDEALGR